MASILSRSIGRALAEKTALHKIAFPNDLGQEFLVDVVQEACTAHGGGDPPFAVLVNPDNRGPDDWPITEISSDDATSYRQDDHVIVSRSGDLSTIGSLAGVFTDLLSEGLPALDLEEFRSGSLKLEDIAGHLSQILGEARQDIDENDVEAIAEAVVYVYTLTARAFRHSGNHNQPWMNRWWVHFNQATIQLLHLVSAPGSASLARSHLPGLVFASAGLPQPEDMRTWQYKVTDPAKTLVTVVDDYFGDTNQANLAIRRMEVHRDDGQRHPLREIDWDLLAGKRLSEGHPVSATLLTGIDPDDTLARHASAWHQTRESEFLDALRHPQAARIEVFLDGVELPIIGENGPYVFPTDRAVIDANGSMVLENVELVVPPRADTSLPVENIEQDPVTLNCKRSGMDAEPCSMELVDGRLRITVTISIAIAARGTWNDKPVRLSLEPTEADGDLPWLLDLDTDATTSLVIPCPIRPLVCFHQRRGDTAWRTPIYAGQCAYERDGDTIEPASTEDDVLIVELKGDEAIAIYAYDGRVTNESHQVSCGDQLGDPWEQWPRGSTILEVTPSNGLIVTVDDSTVEIQSETDSVLPFLPLAATAVGKSPSNDTPPEGMASDLRGQVEELFFEPIVHGEPSFAGHIDKTLGQLAIPTGDKVRLHAGGFLAQDGLFWPAELAEDDRKIRHSYPLQEVIPPGDLEEFWTAFRDLELDEASTRQLRSESGTQQFWPSRTSLLGVKQEKIENYLQAFTRLVERGRKNENPAAHFFASFPFSVFVFNVGEYGKLEAVLLSPLHPVRLAWLWSCEQVVSGWHEDQDVDGRLLQLIAGWNFPIVAPSLAPTKGRMVTAIPIDTGEEDIFIGWNALVDFDNQLGDPLKVPERAASIDVPGASSSGLSEGGIGAALRDFLRVFPHTTTLSIDLSAESRTPRMKKLDEAIIAELSSFVGSEGLQLPGGIRVWDSLNRTGEPPNRDEVLERANRTDIPFPFSWQRYNPAEEQANDRKVGIRFVQESASAVSVSYSNDLSHRSLIPPAPLRRFMVKGRNEQDKLVVSLGLQAGTDPLLPGFVGAILAMELQSEDAQPGLTVELVRSIATDFNATWIVAGDMHLDPVTLNNMIATAGGDDTRRMIWEWRPPYLPRTQSGHLAFFERRPYISIATIPTTFRDLLAQRIEPLVEGSTIEPTEATDGVISMLGERGVGLNSLLAMGHHHETGALGFFFAFQLVAAWQETRRQEKLAYFVLPIDAVDGLLSQIVGDKLDPEETRRADLLVLKVDTSSKPTRITVSPIEIKFYGRRGQHAQAFPETGSKGVHDALDQLRSTVKRVDSMVTCQSETKPGDWSSALRVTGFATLLETAFLLSVGSTDNLPVEHDALANAVNGDVEFTAGRGMLLWFQARDGDNNVSPVRVDLDVKPGDDWPLHAEVFIDPVGCKDDLWTQPSSSSSSAVHEQFFNALSWCLLDPGASPGQPSSPGPAEAVSGDDQAPMEAEEPSPAAPGDEEVPVEDVGPEPPDPVATSDPIAADPQPAEIAVRGDDQPPMEAEEPPPVAAGDEEVPVEDVGPEPLDPVATSDPVAVDPQPAEIAVPSDPLSQVEITVGTIADAVGQSSRPVIFTPSDTQLTQLNIGILGDLGTGKTQLVQSILYQLSRSESSNRDRAPRMLILDYKKDYVDPDFVSRINGQVLEPRSIPLNFFSTAGCTSLNPRFERGRFFTDVLTRIYSGIGPIQKVNLGKAVEESYESASREGTEPTLYDVLDAYKEIAGRTDSVEAILDSLARSGLFEEDASKLASFEELFNKTTIVNLAALGGDQDTKNMLVTIFLNFYYEYMIRLAKNPFISTDDGRSLRFVDSFLLVDEANNILKYDFDVLEQLLLQGREFGTGVILASQFMSHFEQGQKKWKEPLQTWFIHRVPDIRDRDLSGIGISGDNRPLAEQIKSLDLFYCVYKGLGHDGRIIRTRPFFELVE